MTETNGTECTPSRRAVHAPICTEAAEQMRAFCAEHGVTVTAYLDAVGHALSDLRGLSTDKLAVVAPLLEGVLHHARRIDSDRRARA